MAITKSKINFRYAVEAPLSFVVYDDIISIRSCLLLLAFINEVTQIFRTYVPPHNTLSHNQMMVLLTPS